MTKLIAALIASGFTAWVLAATPGNQALAAAKPNAPAAGPADPAASGPATAMAHKEHKKAEKPASAASK